MPFAISAFRIPERKAIGGLINELRFEIGGVSTILGRD